MKGLSATPSGSTCPVCPRLYLAADLRNRSDAPLDLVDSAGDGHFSSLAPLRKASRRGSDSRDQRDDVQDRSEGLQPSGVRGELDRNSSAECKDREPVVGGT